jgi:hypothetical protein
MLATLQTRDFIGQRKQVRFQNPRGRIAFAREHVAYRTQRQTGCAIRRSCAAVPVACRRQDDGRL